MRIFLAVTFSNYIKMQILKIQEQLRSQVLKESFSRGSFSRVENFHLTVAFLGETPEEKLAILLEIMNKIESTPFDLSFNCTGCFTHSRKELWWIGVDPACPGLHLIESIHNQLINYFIEEGFTPDTRPFRTHITLGREIKHAAPIVLDKPDITFKIDHISLMKSENRGGLLAYTELKRHVFTGT